MSHPDRFTVSIDTELLAAFDQHILARGYRNRSEAVRDMIRELLLADRPPPGEGPATTIVSGVWDHGVSDAPTRVRALLNELPGNVAHVLSVPLDTKRDLFTVSLTGEGPIVHSMADRITALRGVSDCRVLSVNHEPKPA